MKSPVTRTSSQDARGQGQMGTGSKSSQSDASIDTRDSTRSRAALLRQSTLGDNSPTNEVLTVFRKYVAFN